ncbi:BCAM0308 family protein [Halalkalibaculum sp. DA384]|uniref:BCAM0308 family protein n=1 Tax=Halalkalibaculum sp. DA384 TaxID=3373606 RepID=UPI003754545B
MERKKKGHIFKQDRARIFKDERSDVYREKKKYKEPTKCPTCGASFIEGRWRWEEVSEQAYKELCPACRRIRDHYPAGTVEISGSFFEEHRKEIMHMIKNLERTESQEHPLERIMEIDTDNGSTLISTTGIHLPRRIGDALNQAYRGELEISYDAETYIRVSWNR